MSTPALRARLPNTSFDVRAITSRVLEEYAQLIVEDVKRGWPVGSGDSLRGFSVRVSGDKILVQNSENYAKFVHNKGSSAPLLEGRVADSVRKYQDSISRDIQKAILQQMA